VVVGKTAYLKTTTSFPVNNFTDFRIQMLNWANRFNIFCFLDNLQYDFSEPAFECLLAAGSKTSVKASAGNAFQSLHEFSASQKEEWLFGHFAYDLKNETAKASSQNFDGIEFPDLYFFVPEIVLQLDHDSVTITCDVDAKNVFNDILSCEKSITAENKTQLQIQNRISKDDYIGIIEKLRQHILRGDCYEINFCQEFFAEDAVIDPLVVYDRLSRLSPNPFSGLYKLEDKYCCCASPERYLKKTGNRVFSQPIKGTSKRDHDHPELDEENRLYLVQSSKEKSENVMVVDLVRNDLSRICIPGSVKVDELFGLYSFPQVHQMISTVSGELEDDADVVDVIKATFPMGSMTGAPKQRVLELIEKYEQTKRGLFSGAIGYFKPTGNGNVDFDFNVVIRSILYNASKKYLSFQTGSGITFYCDAENEYEECLLKAEAMKTILR